MRQWKFTFHLPKEHGDKFSYSTPNNIVDAYRRVSAPEEEGGGIPTSKRIIQDVDKMLYALICIKDEKGGVVEGIATREGHRRYVEYFSKTKF